MSTLVTGIGQYAKASTSCPISIQHCPSNRWNLGLTDRDGPGVTTDEETSTHVKPTTTLFSTAAKDCRVAKPRSSILLALALLLFFSYSVLQQTFSIGNGYAMRYVGESGGGGGGGGGTERQKNNL